MTKSVSSNFDADFIYKHKYPFFAPVKYKEQIPPRHQC